MRHIFLQEDIKPDFDKVASIVFMPRPNNIKELDTFLGMLTYLDRYPICHKKQIILENY